MPQPSAYPLLDAAPTPERLRQLAPDQLPQLCRELRACLIDTVCKTAGHLASGLAVVELTAALHYVFDTPRDQLIWDVGHQSYPHKILTGHRRELATIRHKGGLHAFVWRGETPYDVLTTGHASTGIGSALGLAAADALTGRSRRVICVVGDGALTGGAAYEAMNNAGDLTGLNLLVILNDNDMSISSSVGGLSHLLSQIITSSPYVKFVQHGRNMLKNLPAVHDMAMRAQEHVKGMMMPGTLFEELGFNYVGPVDGHDVRGLVTILEKLKHMDGLQFLHVVTQKGKGYPPAEADPVRYHGVPAFNPITGIRATPHPHEASFSAGFGQWLCAAAAADERVVGITPAMQVGSAMTEFAARFPRRFFDVGIAEQHAMVFASGLAAGGLRPVVNIYSSFLQRAFDGVIHDFALQRLPIVLAVDRGGVVGPDGPTHQGMFDLPFLRSVPDVVIMTPSTLDEQFKMLNTAYAQARPCVVRFPRCIGTEPAAWPDLTAVLPVGVGRITVEGGEVALLAFGSLAADLAPLCREQGWTMADMRFVKPVDAALVRRLAGTHRLLVTVEDGAVHGGVGQEIACQVAALPGAIPVLTLGLPDRFLMEDSREGILRDCGLDAAGILARVRERLRQVGAVAGAARAADNVKEEGDAVV